MEGVPLAGDHCIPQRPTGILSGNVLLPRADEFPIFHDTPTLLYPEYYTSTDAIRQRAEKLFEFSP